MLPIDEIIITYTSTMARWQIIVKGQRQQNKTKTEKHNNNKTGGKRGRRGVISPSAVGRRLRSTETRAKRK